MKKHILLILFSLSTLLVNAQTDSVLLTPYPGGVPDEAIEDYEEVEEDEVFAIYQVEEKASFIHGEDSLYSFISNHLIYPSMALNAEVEGRIVVQFAVNKDSTLSAVTVLGSRILGFGLEEEAIRVIKLSSGMWKPAKQRDKTVRMNMVLPVRFVLPEQVTELETAVPHVEEIEIDQMDEALEDSEATEETDEVLQIYQVQQVAKFKEGESAMYKFISVNINYPEIALEEGVEGRVMVRFTVNRDGSVSDIETVGPKHGYGLEQEAMRIVRKTSGMWEPALQRDKPVKMQFVLPIRFTLVD